MKSHTHNRAFNPLVAQIGVPIQLASFFQHDVDYLSRLPEKTTLLFIPPWRTLTA